MRPSALVQKALEAGWSSACDGMAAVSCWSFTWKKDRGPHKTVEVRAGDRHVSIYISPAGRSVRVFVDNQEIKP